MFERRLLCRAATVLVAMTFGIGGLQAQVFDPCGNLPTHDQLQAALKGAVGVPGNGGLGFNMWASIVALDGTVCAVAFSGNTFLDQWLGSRVISAQKANTANAFSLGEGSNMPTTSLFKNGLALSTANLYSAVQPGGSLYGLQASNPVDPMTAYPGNANNYGQDNDPMVGKIVGGVNVFGGGLVLMSTGGIRVGALGVSGDQSCTDHMIAWRVRSNLGLDHFGGTVGTNGTLTGAVGGVSGDSAHPDNIIFDITANSSGGTGISTSGFGHPTCVNTPTSAALSALPAVQHP
jgi:uncharacterized protein GlcG (DUF336 family)